MSRASYENKNETRWKNLSLNRFAVLKTNHLSYFKGYSKMVVNIFALVQKRGIYRPNPWQVQEKANALVVLSKTATFGTLAHVTGAIVISEVCFTAVAGDCHHVPRWNVRVGLRRDRNRSDGMIWINFWQWRQFGYIFHNSCYVLSLNAKLHCTSVSHVWRFCYRN